MSPDTSDAGSQAPHPDHQARRLPDEGRRGHHHLRGQGQVAAPPGALVLPVRLAARHQDARDGAPRGGRGHHRRPQRGRGAHPGEQPHQGEPPALQHQPQGRQDLPVHQGHRGGVSARVRHAAAGEGRRALLWPVHGRAAHAAVAGAGEEAVHRALLPLQPPQGRPRAAVPGLPHRPLQGAVRGVPDRGRVRGDDRGDHARCWAGTRAWSRGGCRRR